MTLPDGWKRGCLGDLCSIEIGGTPSRGVAAYWDSARDTSNVWISIRDMRQRFITESAEQISGLGVKKSNVKLQQPGTVLLSFKLSIGRVAIAAVPLFTNEAIAGLSPTGLTRDFLFQGLQGWDLLQGVDQAIKGATLNKQKLKRILFEYPESEREQAKIAEVLSTVDRAIEQTEALIAKQLRIKTGLMQDLLTRGIDEHGNLRSEQTHKFKDSPLGRIPEEWKVRSLGQCVGADAPICYGILMPGQGVVNGVPVIKVKDIVGGRIVQDSLLLTDRRIDRQYQRSRLRSGDLLITIRGTTGRLAVVPPELDGANITQDTARVRLNDDHEARFCFYCLQSESAQGQIALYTIGQAVKGINIGDVKRLLLGMPSPHEQERLANQFEGLEKTIHSTSRALAKLKSTKAGLMKDLLTGDRRVTVLLGNLEQVVGA